jgi:hypothetical protein
VTKAVDRAAHGVEEANDSALIIGYEAGRVGSRIKASDPPSLVFLRVLELSRFPEHELCLLENYLPKGEKTRGIVFMSAANRYGLVHAA